MLVSSCRQVVSCPSRVCWKKSVIVTPIPNFPPCYAFQMNWPLGPAYNQRTTERTTIQIQSNQDLFCWTEVQRNYELCNYDYKGVCRTAPATTGLLDTSIARRCPTKLLSMITKCLNECLPKKSLKLNMFRNRYSFLADSLIEFHLFKILRLLCLNNPAHLNKSLIPQIRKPDSYI